MTTSQFDLLLHISNHLQIAWVMGQCVDIYAGLMFIVYFRLWMNEFGGVNVGEISIHPSNQKWVCLGS